MEQQDIQISVPIIGVGSSPVAYADQILDEGTNMTLDEVAKKSVAYGPYASVAAAHTALSANGLNTVGTTVGINGSNNTVVEYWYQGGTAQANLVEKQQGGGGGSEQIQSDWNQTDSTKKDFIKNKPNIPDTSDYYTKPQSDAKYQPKGNYQPAGDYATKTELNSKVDKVSGKGLSTNDYTNEDKAKVGNALVPADIAGKANASDVYTKSETYTKTEVNGLVDTPHQEYETVDAYSNLPETGSKDTIYRVSNYNGSTSQVDASVYSQYAWNGSQYILLCVKSQIGEVFDISVYNNNAKYADLAAALNGGANIPQSLQKGGMSVKFVQSSDNKYVQARLMTQTFSTVVSDWCIIESVEEVREKTKNILDSTNKCSQLIEYPGKNINNQGELVDETNYNTSILFIIKSSTTYIEKNITRLAYYDSQKQFISRPNISTDPDTQTGTFTTPANAAYARVASNKAVSGWQLNEGSTLLTFEKPTTGIYPYTDETLSKQNVPADAKATGEVEERVSETEKEVGVKTMSVTKRANGTGTFTLTLPKTIKQGEVVRLSVSADGVLANGNVCPIYYNVADSNHLISAQCCNNFVFDFVAPTDITAFLIYINQASFVAAGDIRLNISYPDGTSKRLEVVQNSLGIVESVRTIPKPSVSYEYPVNIKSGESVLLYLDGGGVLNISDYCTLAYVDSSSNTGTISNSLYNKKPIIFTAPSDILKLSLYVRVDAFINPGVTKFLILRGANKDLFNLGELIGIKKTIKNILGAGSVNYPVDIKQGEHIRLHLSAKGVLKTDDHCPIYYNVADSDHLIDSNYYDGAIVDFVAPEYVDKFIIYVRSSAFIAAGNSILDVMSIGSIGDLAISSVSKKEIIDNTFGYCYNERDISAKLATYAALFAVDNAAVEPFLFFTDPHLFYDSVAQMNSISYEDRQEAMSLIQKAFNSCAAKYVLCGGDWLTAHKGTDAYTYLGWVDGIMNALFGNKYYLMNGNHDNNYQGKTTYGDDEGGDTITNQEMVNLLYARFGANKMYYSFMGNVTRYYVLDTGKDWDAADMTDYRWQQIAWLANCLLNGNDEHIAIAMHIVYKGNAEWLTTPSAMANNVTLLCDAFNNKTTITLNGVSYDFSQCSGTIHYIIAGHSHQDGNVIINNIPVILTMNTKPNYLGHNITFDLVFADYDAQKMYLTRIGEGNDRVIDIL